MISHPIKGFLGFSFLDNLLHSLKLGPVASNPVNLYNNLLALVWGSYSVLCSKVNDMVAGVGEGNRTTNRTGQSGRDGTGEMGKGKGRWVWEGGARDDRSRIKDHHWYVICKSMGTDTKKNQTFIQFWWYNIGTGRNGRLESELRGIYQLNLELGVLQETNIMDVL